MTGETPMLTEDRKRRIREAAELLQLLETIEAQCQGEGRSWRIEFRAWEKDPLAIASDNATCPPEDPLRLLAVMFDAAIVEVLRQALRDIERIAEHGKYSGTSLAELANSRRSIDDMSWLPKVVPATHAHDPCSCDCLQCTGPQPPHCNRSELGCVVPEREGM
jgi:hypothetical protein